MPDSTATASFGPMPLIAISRSKSCCSSVVRNPYSCSASSRTCVWMRSGDVGAVVARIVERTERHIHLVANALHVNDEQVWLFVEDPAAEECDHPLAGGR